MSMRIKLKHCSEHLKEKWLQDAHELLTAAGVPQWVEVQSMPGNSLPHRLQWYLSRRKDVNEAEKDGECSELNDLDAYDHSKLLSCREEPQMESEVGAPPRSAPATGSPNAQGVVGKTQREECTQEADTQRLALPQAEGRPERPGGARWESGSRSAADPPLGVTSAALRGSLPARGTKE